MQSISRPSSYAITNNNTHELCKLGHGQLFCFEGLTYVVKSHGDNLIAEERTLETSRILKYFGCSDKQRREAHISRLLDYPHQRHFRVDMDKTLVIRQNFKKYPNGGYPPNVNPSDRQKFAVTTLWRHNKPTEVLVKKSLLYFLKQQHELGAQVSITSSGGWQNHAPSKLHNIGFFRFLMIKLGISSLSADEEAAHAQSIRGAISIGDYLFNEGIEISEFDNKKTLDLKLSWFRPYACGGWLEKFFVIGDQNGDGSHNYMIDDQSHQLALFKRKINAREFD